MSTTISTTILRDLRRERGWTQEQLAAESWISRSHIARLESGALLPNRSTIRLLALVLGVDPVELEAGLQAGAAA